MNFTLYIDESGDFTTAKGQWLVAGFLCEGRSKDIDRALTQLFIDLPAQLGQSSIKDFHLKEFRENYGHATAVDMAKSLFKQLDKINRTYRLSVSINRNKVTIVDREKTYRTMIFDLLSVLETTLPEGECLDRLDLVVASRTIGGERVTHISDIDQDVIKKLPDALEVDLATKGLVDIIGNKILTRIEYANDFWGLVVADFLANNAYHNGRQRESEFLSSLAERKLYTELQSFSSFAERRACVAERENNLVLACFRWLLIWEKADFRDEPEELTRVIRKILNELGSAEAELTVEGLLDKVWRTCKPTRAYARFVKLLFSLKRVLVSSGFTGTAKDKYLYRINNLTLKGINHLGMTEEALNILDEQDSLVGSVISNPDNLALVMDAFLVESEVYYNALRVDLAIARAQKYLSLTEDYTSIAALVVGENADSDPGKSRFYVKAKMNYFRLSLLTKQDSAQLEASLEELVLLQKYLTNDDMARYRAILCGFYLLLGKYQEAIDNISSVITPGCSPFDKYTFLKAICYAQLSNESVSDNLQLLVEMVEQDTDALPAHPHELIYRCLAIIHYLSGNKNKASSLCRKGKKCIATSNANINVFMLLENELLMKIFNDRPIDNFDKFNEMGITFEPLKTDIGNLQQLVDIAPY